MSCNRHPSTQQGSGRPLGLWGPCEGKLARRRGPGPGRVCPRAPGPSPFTSPYGLLGPLNRRAAGPGGARQATLALCYLPGAVPTSATCGRGAWGAGLTPPLPFPRLFPLLHAPPSSSAKPGTSRGTLVKPAPAPLPTPLEPMSPCTRTTRVDARPPLTKPDCAFQSRFRPPVLSYPHHLTNSPQGPALRLILGSSL